MKKFMTLILALLMAFALVACGGATTPPADNDNTPAVSAEPTAEVTAEPTVEPTEAATEAPAENTAAPAENTTAAE